MMIVTLRRSGPALALAAVLGSAGTVAAQTSTTAEVVSQGQGWRLLDTAPAVAGNNRFWEVRAEGVANLPIPQAQKDMINEAFAEEPGGVFFASEELFQAMERPEFPAGYEPYIETQAASEEESTTASFSLCSWKTETRNRAWPYEENLFDREFNFTDGVSGHLRLDLPLTGQVQVAATYKIRKCLGVPVGFKFVGATASGNATIAGTGDLDATVGITAQWGPKEWKLAEPELGEVSFSVAWIPVRLVFTLPVYAGAQFNAALTGRVTAQLDASASGTFQYTCTTDTCSGTSNFSDQFEFIGPTASATLDLRARAHARVMLRVAVYTSSFAYVEGGLKAYAEARMWGYLGNACGDGDGNGVNETVQALAADLYWGYQFAYGLGGWILPDRLQYTGTREFPLGWRDLLGTGGSTALSPMIQGPNSVLQGSPATYTIRMRPCYPYTHAINFTMAPGTWTGVAPITPPGGSATVTQTFSTPGNQTLVATAATDSFGRNLRVPFQRVISVTSTAPAAPSGLTATPLSPYAVRLNWTDNSNNETQFEVQRRDPGGSFVGLGSVGANVRTFTDGSARMATTYQYRVRAVNAASPSGFSNTATATTGFPSGYQGCYTDSSARALPALLGGTTHTIESCRQAAYNAGYEYAGLQYFGQCFAGRSVGYSRVSDAECNTPCSANQAQFCGGAWRNSIYATGYVPQPPAAPSGLAASYDQGTRRFTLIWNDNSANEQGFHLQFSYSGSAFSDLSPSTVGANVRTFTSGSNPPTGSYQFRVRSFANGLFSAWSNAAGLVVSQPPPATASIAWIQRAETSWGPAGTLTAAGYAAGGSGGVQLVWRERGDNGVWGPWNVVAWRPPPSADTTWSNTISSGNPTNACHWFDAYVNYSGVSSAVFRYTGAPGCP